jgi:hypothetical protein
VQCRMCETILSAKRAQNLATHYGPCSVKNPAKLLGLQGNPFRAIVNGSLSPGSPSESTTVEQAQAVLNFFIHCNIALRVVEDHTYNAMLRAFGASPDLKLSRRTLTKRINVVDRPRCVPPLRQTL